MQATLALAGRLLVNAPMLAGLQAALRDEQVAVRQRALCVLRRWMLTAKVLAWLVEALWHEWAWVRPQDLACFAFAALSPAWPRRLLAISHRSGEVKPTLSTLHLWHSPDAAIDAAYIPAWETNIGMIWNLFAPVPLLVRVGTPGYEESEWCCREREMFGYLLAHSDFVEGRTIAELDVDQLAAVDLALPGGRRGVSRKNPC